MEVVATSLSDRLGLEVRQEVPAAALVARAEAASYLAKEGRVPVPAAAKDDVGRLRLRLGARLVETAKRVAATVRPRARPSADSAGGLTFGVRRLVGDKLRPTPLAELEIALPVVLAALGAAAVAASFLLQLAFVRRPALRPVDTIDEGDRQTLAPTPFRVPAEGQVAARPSVVRRPRLLSDAVPKPSVGRRRHIHLDVLSDNAAAEFEDVKGYAEADGQTVPRHARHSLPSGPETAIHVG